MTITERLSTQTIRHFDSVADKTAVLTALSETLAAQNPSTQASILDSLLGRERVSSTGMGGGVAIPHGRLKDLEQPLVAFIRVADGVDFGAPDQQPVDLIFGLIVPVDCDETHLQLLKQIATLFTDDNFCAQLRAADDLATTLTNYQPRVAA